MNLYDWKKEGRLSLWRYAPIEKNYPGWHMTADSKGYSCLENLLSLLKTSDVPSKRTVTLDKPSASICCDIKKTLEMKLVIQSCAELVFWDIESKEGKAFLTIGLNQIAPFLMAINEAKSGRYDFSISPTKGQNLWFW